MTRKLMIDGDLIDEQQIREMFLSGQLQTELSVRQKVALKMIGQISLDGRLLDVGCYLGDFLAAVADTYPWINSIGIDAYPDNICIAQLLHPEHVDKFQLQTTYNLGFQSASFDWVTCLEVIEHLDRPVDAIRELNRILRKGGYLIISTPNASSWYHTWYSIRMGYRNLLMAWLNRPQKIGIAIFFENVNWNRHLIEFLPLSLHTLLALNGFELVQHNFVPSGRKYGIIDWLMPGLAQGQIFLMRKIGPAKIEII